MGLNYEFVLEMSSNGLIHAKYTIRNARSHYPNHPHKSYNHYYHRHRTAAHHLLILAIRILLPFLLRL